MLQFTTSLRSAILQAVLDSPVAVVKILTGTLPNYPEDADAGTVLFSFTMSDPSMDLIASQVTHSTLLLMHGTWSGLATETGAGGHFRIYDGDDNCLMQGSVSQTGFGGDMELNTLAIVQGNLVTVTGFTIEAPNA